MRGPGYISGTHEWREHYVMHIMYSYRLDSSSDLKDFEVSLVIRQSDIKRMKTMHKMSRETEFGAEQTCG